MIDYRTFLASQKIITWKSKGNQRGQGQSCSALGLLLGRECVVHDLIYPAQRGREALPFISAQHKPGRQFVSTGPEGYLRGAWRAMWACNSSRSAMPVKYQQTISYVRNVGFLPVHKLISMQAMMAIYICSSMAFLLWLIR